MIRSYLVGAALGLLLASCTNSRASEVSTPEALDRELAHARPGAIVRLSRGEYADVLIRGFKGSVTITSADPEHPAVLHGLTLDNVSGLRLENLDLSVLPTVLGSGGVMACRFQVLRSHDVQLVHLRVHGPDDGTLATEVCGLMVRWSDHVTVEDSDFFHLHNGLQHLDDDFLTVRQNHFHLLRDDGMRGGGSSDVVVENNTCDSNHPDAEDIDHPDCIQFWTANTQAQVHDIVIRNNHYFRGSGRPVQGIFVRDDHLALPFQRVVITGNDIEGALWNGISVDGAVDPIVEDNRVCAYPDQLSWIMIRNTKGARVHRNQATTIKYLNATGYNDAHNNSGERCDPRKPPRWFDSDKPR